MHELCYKVVINTCSQERQNWGENWSSLNELLSNHSPVGSFAFRFCRRVSVMQSADPPKAAKAPGPKTLKVSYSNSSKQLVSKLIHHMTVQRIGLNILKNRSGSITGSVGHEGRRQSKQNVKSSLAWRDLQYNWNLNDEHVGTVHIDCFRCKHN